MSRTVAGHDEQRRRWRVRLAGAGAVAALATAVVATPAHATPGHAALAVAPASASAQGAPADALQGQGAPAQAVPAQAARDQAAPSQATPAPGAPTGAAQSHAALSQPAPAQGAPTQPTSPDYSRADSNFAGTQIAAHEGVQGTPRADQAGQTLGHDVSGHQGPVDWPAAAAAGAKFTYVKATEGTGFVNPQFIGQYDGAHAAGIIRGAYHFARPDISSGAAQAEYFIAHGGGWSPDGTTLPGALDIEYNPYGDVCYGKSAADMTAWIADFTRTYLAKVKRSALIYTSTAWWKRCTGNTAKFGNTDPLWLARYGPEVGELPAGWDKHSIWQFARGGGLPGDQNYYNGPIGRVQALAKGA